MHAPPSGRQEGDEMTTTVIIQYPRPNHLCARVVNLTKDQHGCWNPEPIPSILGPDNQIVQAYVHSGQRLIIDEISAGETKALPGGELAIVASIICRLWPDIAEQIRSAMQKIDKPLTSGQMENLERFLSVMRQVR